MPGIQVQPKSPLYIFPLCFVIRDIEGKLHQPDILPAGPNGGQILQSPHAAHGLKQDGILGGKLPCLQFLLAKRPGPF